MKKKLLIIFLSILILAGGVIMVIFALNRHKFKKDTLRSCSYSIGGGMLGGYTNHTLSRNKDGSVTLTVRSKEVHYMRENTTVYQVSPDALDHIRELVDQYDLYRASKRPMSKEQVLDGDTTSLSFSFTKDSFSVSDSQVLSKTMRTGFREFIQYMDSLKNDTGVTTVEPQNATLYLRSGYTLQFEIEDAFDGKLDEILSEEYAVTAFKDNGIVLHAGIEPDLSGAEPVQSANAGNIIYDCESGQIVLLYADYQSEQPLYLLAQLKWNTSTAYPLIREMEGSYKLQLN